MNSYLQKMALCVAIGSMLSVAGCGGGDDSVAGGGGSSSGGSSSGGSSSGGSSGGGTGATGVYAFQYAPSSGQFIVLVDINPNLSPQVDLCNYYGPGIQISYNHSAAIAVSATSTGGTLYQTTIGGAVVGTYTGGDQGEITVGPTLSAIADNSFGINNPHVPHGTAYANTAANTCGYPRKS